MPANPVLVIGQAQKASGDSIRLPMDFGDCQQIISLLTDQNGNYVPGNLAITSFGVSCNDPGGPTISSQRLDYPYQLSCIVSGGLGGGQSYNIVYTVTLNDPDHTILSRTGQLVVF